MKELTHTLRNEREIKFRYTQKIRSDPRPQILLGTAREPCLHGLPFLPALLSALAQPARDLVPFTALSPSPFPDLFPRAEMELLLDVT